MKQNDQGDFFINEDECVSCGCCENTAPSLFASNESEYASFVSTQPSTPDEMKSMFRASRICMVDCIYYSGEDELLAKYFKGISKCFDERGLACTSENCPCFEDYLTAKYKNKT